MTTPVSSKDRQLHRTAHAPGTKEIAAVEKFDAWIEDQPFRAGTKRVYKAIWGKFVRKMIGEGRDLAKLHPDQVRLFLETLSYSKKNEGTLRSGGDAPAMTDQTTPPSPAGRKNVKRQQRERYAFMIERALLALMPPEATTTKLLRSGQGWGGTKEATWRDVPANAEFRVLPIQERRQLEEKLVKEARALHARADELTAGEWRRLRDTAIVTMLYGAGLKAGEIPWLSVNCIKYAPEVGVAAVDTHEYNGVGPADRALAKEAAENKPHVDAVHAHIGDGRGAHRLVPVMPWVMEILAPWADHVAATYGAPAGEHTRLFPVGPTYSSGRLSFMNPSTLARIVGKWWPVDEDSSEPQLVLTAQVLRNSFAGNLIDAGVGLDDMETLMGYAEGSSGAFRLREVYLSRIPGTQLALFK